MINLLPQKDQILVRNLYLIRLLLVILLSFLSLSLIGLILLYPSRVNLISSRDELKKEVSLLNTALARDDNRGPEAKAALINSKLETLNRSLPAGPLPTIILTRLFAKKSAYVMIKSVHYDQATAGRLTVAGSAKDRASIVLFVDALKTEPIFAVVDSPISNIISGQNPSFTISITLRPLP